MYLLSRSVAYSFSDSRLCDSRLLSFSVYKLNRIKHARYDIFAILLVFLSHLSKFFLGSRIFLWFCGYLFFLSLFIRSAKEIGVDGVLHLSFPEWPVYGILNAVLVVDMLYIDIKSLIVRDFKGLFLTVNWRVMQNMVIKVRLLGQSP